MDADTTGRVEAILASGSTKVTADAALKRFEALADEVLAGLKMARARSAKREPSARKILIVDDNAGILAGYTRTLRDLGEVDIAATVEEAFIKITETLYDVMVVDYQLTNGTAADLTALMRGTVNHRYGYTILVSGVLDSEAGDILARRIGADEWLPKPVHVEHLRDRVCHAFEVATHRRGECHLEPS